MDTKTTYLGGATYLLEIGSFRFITDPGFDPKDTEKDEGPGHLLKKTMAPPIPVEEIGKIDAVFLSHQQHYDNLDISGRTLLSKAGRVFTTPESATVLGKNTEGLETWQTVELTNEEGEKVKVTGMPAVHTTDEEIRPVIGETMGFLLEWEGQQDGAFYLSGDTVWIDEIEEIGRRYNIGIGILNMGAANVPAVGDRRLTMNGEEGARVAQTLNLKTVYPAHFEGWMHYKEGIEGIKQAFEDANLNDVLEILKPGQSVELVI
ncbi:MAG: MBL fold metallo-hydrolase [Proteobacteria bacterium]|nr:MBL fold metallo-hydrolase [Pseudomonadota bacterium]